MTRARLPDAEWQHHDGLKRIVAALDDVYGGPRYVGGAVRDTLLGLPVSDVDIATALLPNEVINRLEAAGIKAIPTGIEHGTVTAAVDGKNYEITTLRRDVATDGRRATVAFATDWQEDASRRDFTINALYADPKSGEVFDYFNGLSDLEARRLRFIGDAHQRIAEDFLRILRYFRFLARYGGGQIDADAIAACATGAHGLTALSRERIAQELTRILGLQNPVASVLLMIASGIFSP
jgi:poly(A) polymerase